MDILEMMDAQKDSKTLEEGSMEPKLGQSQNPCGQTLEEACDVPKFGKNCNVSVLAADENEGGSSGGIDVKITNNEVSGILGSGDGFEGFESEELVMSEDAAEENHIKGGFLVSAIEKGILVKCHNVMNIGDGSPVEEVQEASEDEEIGVENDVTEEAVEKSDGALQLHGSDSPGKIEISGNGISLFVEVFGPLDGIDQAEEGKSTKENELREDVCDEKYSCETNGTLPFHFGEDTSAEVSDSHGFMLHAMTNETVGKADELLDEGICNEECNFAVGDLVWAETKTKLWWPGVISDPSNVSKDVVGPTPKGSFVVKYFGNPYFAWCSPFQLKHFLEHFEQMAHQNNSRSFHGAMERAISEIGRRVKEEMTCSCSSKGSQRFSALSPVNNMNDNSESNGKVSELCAFSSSQFEPASFLAFIKHHAQNVCLPGKINLTISQNCLSAFYSSLGHCQLPVHHLRSTDAKDGAQNGFKAEDLTKSKSRGEIGERKPIPSIVTSSSGKIFDDCSGKVEISSRCQIISSEIEQSSALKSRRVTEGYLLCGHNGDGRKGGTSEKCNELRERRKSKYLSYPYISPSGDKKDAPTSSKNEIEEPKKVSSGGKNSLKKGSTKSGSGLGDFGNPENLNISAVEMLSELHLKALDCLRYEERRYCGSIERFFSSFRRFAFLNHEMANVSNGDSKDPVEFLNHEMAKVSNGDSKEPVEFLNHEMAKVGNGDSKETFECPSSSSKPNECKGMDSDATKSEKVSRKRKKAGKVSGISKIETLSLLPDLNANNTTLSVEGLQVTGDAPSKGGQKKRKRKQKPIMESSCTQNALSWLDMNGKCVKFVPLLKAVEAAGANFLKSVPQQNNMEAEPDTAPAIMVQGFEANENYVESGSLVKRLQQTQLSPPSANPERKKRKRREKKSKPLNTEVTSSIPDLNGYIGESNSLGNNVPDLNSVSPKAKPRQKRRRTKSSAAVSDSNVNHNKLQKDVELSGAILLNFAIGFPLPSVEFLFTTFSGYGSLKESETRFLDDSSAQVVFLRSSDAAEAFRSLQKSNPFGPALAGYRFHHLPAASSTPKPSINLQMAQPYCPMDGLKTPAMPSGVNPQSGDTPDLLFIKQNLEMMTSMLEKAGNNLSPEMRAKLESEIKGFMKKVNSMVGSSSS